MEKEGIVMMKQKPNNEIQVDNLRDRYQLCMKIMVLIGVFFLAFNGLNKTEIAKADVGVIVNYVDEMAYVSTATGSSIRFYVSTDKKNWDSIDTGNALDITGYLAAKEVTLFFKGNKDPNPVSVTLMAEPSDIKAVYEVVAGVGKVTITPSGIPIEYRRGDKGSWKTVTSPVVTGVYEIKGTTLNFRTPATGGRRAGKIIAVKIPKRPAAPPVKLEGSKLCISGLKSGETQYRIGDTVAWSTFTTPISSVKYINLSTLLNLVANVPNTATYVEFRSLGSDKKVISNVKLIDIPAQPVCPETITLTGTTLKVTDTDLKKQYEYTIVTAGSALNLDTAKWTSLSSKNAVVVSKAKISDKIYVRAKSYTNTSKELVLASTYKEFTVSSITTK